MAIVICDLRLVNKIDAVLSILRTFFISFVLAIGAMVFSADVELMIVEPIESTKYPLYFNQILI